jgi:nitroimidazol reductase NimA-like FMN-containing flavoprotein (pyridoxamine 5'-phosphate oxidase superfamily)
MEQRIMTIDPRAGAASHVRRADRAVNDEAWIASFLTEAPYGFLATSDEGIPFINSNLFVFDASRQCIYLHTARLGRTRSNIEAGEQGVPVCFSISTMGRLLPADEALEFSVEYTGVTVFGTAQVVDDVDEQRHGLQMLLDKYFPHLQPGRDYRPIIDEELKRTSVYRVDIREWSGKRKHVADDFPGAFLVEDLPALRAGHQP